MRWNLTCPGLILRGEGAAMLVAATTLYGAHGGSWPLFLLLVLVPDLSALGFVVGPTTGAACYNVVHTYVGPIALGGVGLAAGHPWASLGALIWAAHIGMDRLLGYGLKEPGAFKQGGEAPVRHEPRPGNLGVPADPALTTRRGT
jgi:hypothetical protein